MKNEIEHNAMEEQANSLPSLERAVVFNPDHADGYLGNDDDGVYWQVEYLSQETIDEHNASDWRPGWYVTAVVDCDSAGFVGDLFTDLGPFATEEEAQLTGHGAAADWCFESGIEFDDNGEELTP